MGVPETTMKSALATLAAAGINDGDENRFEIEISRRFIEAAQTVLAAEIPND